MRKRGEKQKRKKQKLWVALLILAFLTPLGLWVPRFFGAGGAWGEWSWRELEKTIGYAPAGLKRINGLWRAPAAGYGTGYLGYLASALAGVLIVAAVSFAIGKLISKHKDQNGGKRKK